MENILFSLNIVMPIFFLILLGAFLKRIGIFTEEFRSAANKLVFYVALPAALFRDMASSDIVSIFNLRFLLYAVGASLVIFFLAWILAKVILKEPAAIGASVHGAFRGNFAYIGLPVIRSLMGIETVTAGIMVIAVVIPIYNILATLILSYYDPTGGRPTVRSMALKIIKNPLILSILIGLPFSLWHITLPTMVDTTVKYVGQISTPLALLMIGAALRADTFKSKKAGILLTTVIKIVVAPLIGTAGAILIGIRGEELVTLFVMFAVPSAVSTYIMTRAMKGDGEMAAGIVMVTSLLGIFTMAVGITILRGLGYLG